MFRSGRTLINSAKRCHRAPVRTLSSSASTSKAGVGQAKLVASAAILGLLTLSWHREPLALDAPKMLNVSPRNSISAEEIKEHNTPESCWVVLDGIVWDVTEFLQSHPGGAGLILEHATKDITPLFRALHPPRTLETIRSQLHQVGPVDPASIVETVSADGIDVQTRRDALPPPEYVINLREFETLAQRVLGADSRPWGYFSSWADDGESFRATANSFSFLRFLPRINVPVANVSLGTSFLGEPVPLPVFFSPTGQGRQGHPDGELNLTRGGSRSGGVPQGVSSAASVGIDEVCQERDSLAAQTGMTRVPIWWQLYIKTDREETAERIRTAARCGADAILITVDVAALGKREADGRPPPSSFKNPSASKSGLGVAAATGASQLDADLSWDDIAWVRKNAPNVPILIKGVQCPEDVALAKHYGADGVILSNHGGRQLDGASPPIATLIRTRQSNPELFKDGEKFEVYIDGGFRRGTDVLKALCLGARGVGLGRAMIYAQACYGEEGVVRVCQILSDEIATGMRLLGAKTVKDLKPEMVELLPGLVGERMK